VYGHAWDCVEREELASKRDHARLTLDDVSANARVDARELPPRNGAAAAHQLAARREQRRVFS